MTDDKKKVKLVADGVNPGDRYVFNLAAAFEDKSRGEVVSQLLREFAERRFGKEAVAAYIREFEEQGQANTGEITTDQVLKVDSSKPSGLDL